MNDHWQELYEGVLMADEGTICRESEGWVWYPVEAASIPCGPYRTLDEAEHEAEAHRGQ